MFDERDFGKTVVKLMWWVLVHCVVCALILLGIISRYVSHAHCFLVYFKGNGSHK